MSDNKMKMRRFQVNFNDDQYCIIEISQAAIDMALNDEWRSVFYNLHTPENVAEALAYAACVNNQEISNIEGWMMPDENMVIIEYPDLTEFYFETKEIAQD